MNDTKVLGGSGGSKADVVAREMLPYQWKALNDHDSGRGTQPRPQQFPHRRGEAQGTHGGMIFQDSEQYCN